MKTGLIMEGGAMRGMFTAGVIDVMLENGITTDGAIGVSAGAAFGCNYKSKQIGRAIRYNVKYCRNPRYASLWSLLLTGNFYGKKFCYQTLPEKLDVFDKKSFQQNPVEFYVVATDVETGKPAYMKCENGNRKDLQYIRASASMPLVSKIVKIDGGKYLDGGSADSVPIKYFQSIGYEKNVVILTQPDGYKKQPNNLMKWIKRVYKKYPAYIHTLEVRHNMYNETIEYIKQQENTGNTFVIRPPQNLEIGAREKNPENLKRVYNMGRKTAEENLEKLKQFLKGE